MQGTTQEIRIRMHQLMDENTKLRKMYKSQLPPTGKPLHIKAPEAADKKVERERNLQALTRRITPLNESLSGEDFTARELLDSEYKEDI